MSAGSSSDPCATPASPPIPRARISSTPRDSTLSPTSLAIKAARRPNSIGGRLKPLGGAFAERADQRQLFEPRRFVGVLLLVKVVLVEPEVRALRERAERQ